MPKIHIQGRVLPDGFRLTIENLPALTWKNNENGKHSTYLVNIVDSHIGIEIDTEETLGSDISQFTNQAFELARAAVDGFCFHRGIGLSVTLSTLFNEEGSEQVLLSLAPNVDEFIGDKDLLHVVEEGALDSLYSFMSSDPSIALAFNDLIAGITFPRTAEINCARCVEGIAYLIAGNRKIKDDKARWELMRNSLNISKEYAQEITNLSTLPRHGFRGFIPPEEIQRVIKKAWIIMQRFIQFHIRGQIPLPLDEFPILVSQTLQS